MGLNQVTLIEDLVMKHEPEDDNLIIVEDSADTKKTTIREIKKGFIGDYKDPDNWRFYSSKHVESLLNDLKRIMSSHASSDDVNALAKRVESIVANAGNDNTEIVDARDGENSLSSRLLRDKVHNEDMYLKKVRRTIEGKKISTGMNSYVDAYLYDLKSSTNLIVQSKNIFDISQSKSSSQVDITDTGFKYTQQDNTNMEFELSLGKTIPSGTYIFYSSISHDTGFLDVGNIVFAVKNTDDDSAYTEFEYNQGPKFIFSVPKAFNTIKFKFNKDKFVTNAYTEYSNIMITKENCDEVYIPYFRQLIPMSNNEHVKFYNENYDISCSDSDATIVVQYYDQSIDLESVLEKLQKVTDVALDNMDQCGLIKNRGEYLFFNDETIVSVDGNENLSNDVTDLVGTNPRSVRLSYDDDIYMRNGVPSLKVTFNEDVDKDPSINVKVPEYTTDIESLTLVFYVDATVSQYFSGSPEFTINLCSDDYNEPEMVNYFYSGINISTLIQGWNIVKIPFIKFESHGNPNEHGIKYINLVIDKNSNLDNKSIYLNSFVFNQQMKPTVLLAFDGIYEDGITYTYPYLYSRGIPATILSNNRQTFSNNILGLIETLRTKYGWDLGQYGCNPKKEILTEDDNSRDQYLALKLAREWLQTNLVYNPISYSAPFGNLRPITVPILKDMGYKIAKVKSDGTCNFFDPRYDFAIPMYLMSNEVTEDEVIGKIQYAIDNNCCVCIYTNNVTEYGDELSSKKVMFENVIKFITDNSDKLSAMTFSDFYNKCNGN